MNARSTTSLAFALALGACTGPSSTTPDTSAQRGPNPQGTELLAVPPALEGFWIEATGGASFRGKPMAIGVVQGQLVGGKRRGRALVGTELTATAPDGSAVPMRIAGILHHQNPWNGPRSGPKRQDYVIEYRDRSGAWLKLCPDDYPGAMLIPGSFALRPDSGSNGDYDPSPGRFTFACREGVASKCVDWGYPPWSARGGDMAAYFQACTRMARADYCGNGRSRTVDETMIIYGDSNAPPIIPFVPQQGFVPEAVWGSGSGTKGEPAAICLSRTRWSTIPIGRRSPCADIMPDPREELADTGPRRFCDDLTVADWAKEPGTMFVNSSRAMDVGLYVWTDGAGRYVTTSQFPWLGKGVEVPAPPGYPEFVSIEGSTYKPSERRPKRPGLIPLYRYTKKDGASAASLTTTDEAPGHGFGERVLEAWIFAPSADAPTSTAQRLFLYTDGKGGYVTMTDPAPPAGYAKAADLGWLPH